MTNITVIGAGVIGLTTAIRLAENGYKVHVIAEHFTPNTTSDKAAAFWEPFAVEPRDKVMPWAARTLAVLCDHAENPDTGVFPAWCNYPGLDEEPWWSGMVESRWETLVTPAGLESRGFRYQTYVADMSFYMPWLHRKAKENGVTFENNIINDISSLAGPVVFCVGNGARDLLNDTDLKSVRGVIVVYPGNLIKEIWLNDSQIDEGELSYIVPRRNVTIVGGTYEKNVSSEIIDEEIVRALQERAYKIMPILKSHKPLKIYAGFRPTRSSVRVEKDEIDGKAVIYNYGHGGGGLTLSWGCADKVVELLR